MGSDESTSLNTACELNIVIQADPAALAEVQAGMHDLLGRHRWPEDDVMKVELALQEALTNAIRHGCKNDATKQIQCLVTFDADGALIIVVRDPGEGFEVAQVPDPLDGANLFKPSGRGVFLINQLMDQVEFADQGRQVVMRKRKSFS